MNRNESCRGKLVKTYNSKYNQNSFRSFLGETFRERHELNLASMCWKFLHFLKSTWEVNSLCNRTQTDFIKWCHERWMDLVSINGVYEIILFSGRTFRLYEMPAICGTQNTASLRNFLQHCWGAYSAVCVYIICPNPLPQKEHKELGCSPTQNFVLVIQWKFRLEPSTLNLQNRCLPVFNIRIMRVKI
jgi:hypothetical protein